MLPPREARRAKCSGQPGQKITMMGTHIFFLLHPGHNLGLLGLVGLHLGLERRDLVICHGRRRRWSKELGCWGVRAPDADTFAFNFQCVGRVWTSQSRRLPCGQIDASSGRILQVGSYVACGMGTCHESWHARLQRPYSCVPPATIKLPYSCTAV